VQSCERVPKVVGKLSGDCRVRVEPLPVWLDWSRLLGPGSWHCAPAGDGWIAAEAVLPALEAADLSARLRGVGIAGRALEVGVRPGLPRGLVRAARAAEARRLRDGSPGFDRAGARLDDEARWSLTPAALALAIGRRALGASVIDAGCGAGGNAIGFARAGCAVTAIESDAQRLAMARHNAALYGVDQRIAFVAGDAASLTPRLSAELLFVDPPWGKAYDKHRVVLGDLPLLASLLSHRSRFGRLWAKVPASFDPTSAPSARPVAFFGVGSGDARRIKFLLLEFE
jgi:SAM-dependent methyltransferase